MKINMIERVFDADKRHMYRVLQQAKKVNSWKETMRQLTDEQLQNKTIEFQARLQKGESVDALLPEAYAVVREAAGRVLGEYPYDVQVVGAIILHHGDIALMKTGEGKTLTSTMPIYLNGLAKKGVHVVTTNDYLASRDAATMGQVFQFLGLTVGYNHRQLTPVEKQAQFLCDITYTTNAELGFDYLRDGMVMHKSQRVLRGLSFALIDEVDSILIDEARTPLIISGGQKDETIMFAKADQFAKALKQSDYEIEVKDKQVFLTESGIQKAEQFFQLTNLYHPEHMTTVHFMNQALRANYIMKKDVDYVAKETEILIVDEYTGRAMEGRNYSNGLHQAIEAKEGIVIKQENTTLATITYQNFFRLYGKLAGMSGTAKTDEQEFLETYNMRVLEVETNLPVVRVDDVCEVYATRKEKYHACVQEVKTRHGAGQPVLIGTAFIQDSEYMSKLLEQEGIRHTVLNAKNHALEAEIIAKAGQRGAVTIATNMAGRGTDIKLGEGVNELGGLAVLGLQRHESKRIDNQLLGRSGRQGDQGYSKFYVSLEDDLIRRYANDEEKKSLAVHLGQQDKVRRIIDQIQSTVEQEHYHSRKHVLEYDNVMRQQRSVISEQRDYIMDCDQPLEIIESMMHKAVEGIVFMHELELKQKQDYQRFVQILNDFHGPIFDVNQFMGLNQQELMNKASTMLVNHYTRKTKEIRSEISDFERIMLLRQLDQAWIAHVDEMMALKEGIHLRSYAQVKPSDAYESEGFERFKEMLWIIANDVVEQCMQLQVLPQLL